MTLSEYNQCVTEFSDGIFRFLFSLTKDKSHAEDLTQDVFERSWSKIDSIDIKRAKSYLFQMAHNAFVDDYRKNKRLVSTEENPGLHLEVNSQPHHDLQEWLQVGLDQLSNRQKECILLRDYEGYAYQEIAEILEMSLEQVKIEIYRGRVSLKKFIGSQGVLV